MNKISIYAGISLVIAVSILTIKVQSLTKEKNRLSNNQETLLSEVEYYKTADSLSVASVGKLTLTKKEFEKHNTELSDLVKSLNLKVKDLQSITTTAIESKYNVKATLRDSVVIRYNPNFRDSVLFDTIKCFSHHSPYIDLVSCTDDNVVFDTEINIRDTIINIPHRVRYKFWFIRWGTKGIMQKIVNKNKNSKIVYSEYIEFE